MIDIQVTDIPAPLGAGTGGHGLDVRGALVVELVAGSRESTIDGSHVIGISNDAMARSVVNSLSHHNPSTSSGRGTDAFRAHTLGRARCSSITGPSSRHLAHSLA